MEQTDTEKVVRVHVVNGLSFRETALAVAVGVLLGGAGAVFFALAMRLN